MSADQKVTEVQILDQFDGTLKSILSFNYIVWEKTAASVSFSAAQDNVN